MQATVDSASLKHITKALTCLSRYGEDLVISATPDYIAFSATNISMSAFCRFRYKRQFFSRYNVATDPRTEEACVTGQLVVKPLLAILKHRTNDKTVEKCELTITDGGATTDPDVDEEEQDSLESKLIVRLHCKHGVVKTHRILLSACTPVAPTPSDADNESRITIAPRTLKEMLDHFPFPRGPKSDPQIVWKFLDSEVVLRGHENSLDINAKGQLSSELSLSADEFEAYDIYETPITVAFHLKEFFATLSLADNLCLNIDIRFTDPTAPLFIELDGDLAETLFVLSTSQVAAGTADQGTTNNRIQAHNRGKKRELESESEFERQSNGHQSRAASEQRFPGSSSGQSVPGSARKKPTKAAVRTDRESVGRELSASYSGMRVTQMMPPPTAIPPRRDSIVSDRSAAQRQPRHASPPRERSQRVPSPAPVASSSRSAYAKVENKDEPLFFPSSQMSQAAMRESGLGLEDMDPNEFAAMWEGDGEEVDVAPRPSQSQSRAIEEEEEMQIEDPRSSNSGGAATTGTNGFGGHDADVSMEDEVDELAGDDASDSFDLYETQFGPTQPSNSKGFRPLFDD